MQEFFHGREISQVPLKSKPAQVNIVPFGIYSQKYRNFTPSNQCIFLNQIGN